MGSKTDNLWYNRAHLPPRDVLLDIPAEEYHAHKALGHTDLLRVAKSPNLYRYHKDNPVDPDTKALVIGSATHTAALEPDKFDEQFQMLPSEIEGHGPRSGHYKQAMAAMKADQPGVKWLSPTDYDLVMSMAESALAHPVLRKFLERPHKVEGSCFFRVIRCYCKCRPDLVAYGKGREVDVLDLKTCVDASPKVSGFPRQIANWGYDTQAVFYTRGLENNGLKVKSFTFLAVEKSPPYLTGAYQIDPKCLTTARDIIAKSCATFVDCNKRDSWPGYGEKVHVVELPEWRSPRENPKQEDPPHRLGDMFQSVKQLAAHVNRGRDHIYRVTRLMRKNKLVEWKKVGGRLYIHYGQFMNLYQQEGPRDLNFTPNSETFSTAKDVQGDNGR